MRGVEHPGMIWYDLFMTSQIAVKSKPLLRGYIHLAVAAVTPYALVQLVLIADSPRAFVGASIFGVSLILLYLTSGVYHVSPLTWRFRSLAGKLDHSMIFLFIAGAYTPFLLKTLGDGWGIPMLSVIWTLAAVGIVLTTVPRFQARWIAVSLYLTLGWIALIPIVQLVTALPTTGLVMLVVGGLLYSFGGFMYAARWPDPFPRVFGYHEAFHSMVVAASMVLYLVVAIYVLPS